MENSRRRAPEAHHLHGPTRHQEQIGHMLVAAERADNAQAAGKAKPEKVARGVNEKHVATMQRAELLSLSETIVVDGSSLRQIYESHLVGERGLRRLITEYLRGGDLKKALRQEVVEREIDFERDPAMRDQPHQVTPVSSSTASGRAALNTLLKKAAANLPDNSEEVAFFKARAHYETAQHAQQQKQRRLIDIALTSAIIILISAVILLYFRSN